MDGISAAHPALTRLAQLPEGDPFRQHVRGEAICAYLPLARRLARRFYRCGEPVDDLMQVAILGLIKSVDRFDIGRGVPFVRYATPTIVGELKRYVRDVGWRLRIPRRLQELHLEIVGLRPSLTQTMGRAPTIAELSHRLGVSEGDVLAGLECAAAYRPHSLNSPVGPATDATELGDTLAGQDDGVDRAIDRTALQQIMTTLPEREQRILLLRFAGELTQSEIADEIGLSAMHVSRLLRRSLAILRAGLLAEAA